jgi:hypothetical protein
MATSIGFLPSENSLNACESLDNVVKGDINIL